jgi:DNA-binding transcriptional regulator YhcF (GntR family)
MAPTVLGKRPVHGLEKVREHLLTSLHLGKLRPGDRVLSVRRLADMTGMNRKTVHRAYRVLVREGFLDARPGAGTFVAPGAGPGSPEHREDDLLLAVNRCRAEAHGLGLSPSAFADFAHNALNGGLEGLPLCVVECNREQIDMISRDVKAGLKANPRPFLLSEFVNDPQGALAGAWGVVTTDCHRAEVERAARTVGAPVYRVALDPEFPQKILRWARTRPVVLCVHDERFGSVFLRFLGQLGASGEVLARVRPVTPARLRAELRAAGDDAVLLVSPLAEREAGGRIPVGIRPTGAHWRLAEGTIERLRASISFDVASRREGHA